MTNSEKLCLKWNDFQENTYLSFGSLREDQDFVDVTLACEDGQQVQGHKVILSAASPFFYNLIKNNKHSHPLIYMRGIKSTELVALMDFMYHGEASIYQENLNAFMVIAEELKLKGLTGGDETIKDDVKVKSKAHKISSENLTPLTKTVLNRQHNAPNQTLKVYHDPDMIEVKPLEDVDLDELHQQVKSMMRTSDTNIGKGQGFSRICTACGKEGANGNIQDHIETYHINGISLSCNFCEKVFKTRRSLKVHANSHNN